MTVGIDLGPIDASVVGYPGDDLTLSVILVDFTSGPITLTGATVVATAGAQAFTVAPVADGLATLTLSDSQTTTLGAGTHTFIYRVTPAGGATTTYIHGSLVLRDAGTPSGSTGWQAGIVGNVLVGLG